MTLMATNYIEPGSPWEDWRQEYNTYRPHSALGGLTPSEYATATINNNQNNPEHA
jgi:hypothetical protein